MRDIKENFGAVQAVRVAHLALQKNVRHGRKVGALPIEGTSLGEIREKVWARMIGTVDDLAVKPADS